MVKGIEDAKTVDNGDKRVAALGKSVAALNLPKGIFMSKKTMQVVYHAEAMRRL